MLYSSQNTKTLINFIDDGMNVVMPSHSLVE